LIAQPFFDPTRFDRADGRNTGPPALPQTIDPINELDQCKDIGTIEVIGSRGMQPSPHPIAQLRLLCDQALKLVPRPSEFEGLKLWQARVVKRS
jgi:hypothetical protein